MGVGALGLVHRGFDTVVKPTLEKPLVESGCVSCGQCVSVCPTGALQERLTIRKSVPLDTDQTDTTCSYCSVGCSLHLETYGDMLVKAVPDKEGAVNKGLLCGKGKFGFDCAAADGKLLDPMIKREHGLEDADYHEAFVLTAKKAQSIAAKYGKDAVAVAVSDRYTNEEAYAIKKFADAIGAKTLCFNNRQNGAAKVLGFDASPNTIDELLATEVILVTGFNTVLNPVIQIKLKQAAEAGAKVVLINPVGFEQHLEFAAKVVYVKNDVTFLKEVAKALLDMGKTSKAEGFDEFAASLSKVAAGDDAKADVGIGQQGPAGQRLADGPMGHGGGDGGPEARRRDDRPGLYEPLGHQRRRSRISLRPGGRARLFPGECLPPGLHLGGRRRCTDHRLG
jgi:formate dehydrogenase major subunit